MSNRIKGKETQKFNQLVKLLVSALSLRRSSQTKRRNKIVFNYCQTSVLLLSRGNLVDHQAYKPYTLVGPQDLQLLLDPLAVIFLNNLL